jgi:hypothetical protein
MYLKALHLQLSPYRPSEITNASGEIPVTPGPPKSNIVNNNAMEIEMESLVAGERRAV